MPKSAKPRKHYRPRNWPRYALFLPKPSIEAIKGLFVDIGIIVETTLPAGKCEADHLQMMRDMLNLGTALVLHSPHLTPEFKAAFGEELGATQAAFKSLYGRFLKTESGVATGDEINALREGFETLQMIIEGEMDRQPSYVLDVFNAIKRVTDGRGWGRIDVTTTQLEKQIAAVRSSSYLSLIK